LKTSPAYSRLIVRFNYAPLWEEKNDGLRKKGGERREDWNEVLSPSPSIT